ncbi:MAG: succinate dehydrogenase assembly factor 2 [Alphaproteobacteria bacterium]|nr:succinate dehydrogenase assembly factor 2 [Alphaproteobacteria bacterium]
MTDDLENKRKRLIFRAGHRGTKEMDLLLGGFALEHVPKFDAAELEAFEGLLTENDPDLYNWISRVEEAPANIAAQPVFQKLMAYKFA